MTLHEPQHEKSNKPYLVNTGKNQYHLLSPNTCSAFFIADPKLKPSLFGP